jgi:hypothetical protein
VKRQPEIDIGEGQRDEPPEPHFLGQGGDGHGLEDGVVANLELWVVLDEPLVEFAPFIEGLYCVREADLVGLELVGGPLDVLGRGLAVEGL